MTEQLQDELTRCPAGMASRLVGVSQQTLRAWAKAGKITGFKSPGGRYQFDVRPFVEKAAAPGAAPGWKTKAGKGRDKVA